MSAESSWGVHVHVHVNVCTRAEAYLSAESSWGVTIFEPTVGGFAMEMCARSTPVDVAAQSRRLFIGQVACAQSVPLRLIALAASGGVEGRLSSEAGSPTSCHRTSSASSLNCSECESNWMATWARGEG